MRAGRQQASRWQGADMCNEARLNELQRQIERLREMVDEIQAVYEGLEQHVIRTTATLRVVVELAKER